MGKEPESPECVIRLEKQAGKNNEIENICANNDAKLIKGPRRGL